MNNPSCRSPAELQCGQYRTEANLYRSVEFELRNLYHIDKIYVSEISIF